MLTGLAILERELGINDYKRHLLRRRLAAKPPEDEARRLRRELRELEKRRADTLRVLEEQHAQYEQRRLTATDRRHEPTE